MKSVSEILLNKNTQLSILNLTKENSEEQYNYHNTNDILVSTRVLQFITTYGNTLFVTEGLSCLNKEETTNDSKIEEYLTSVEEVINNFFNIPDIEEITISERGNLIGYEIAKKYLNKTYNLSKYFELINNGKEKYSDEIKARINLLLLNLRKINQAIQEELKYVEDGIVTEGAFIDSVKNAFIAIVLKIRSILVSGFKDIDFTYKYQMDRVNELKSLNKDLSIIEKFKFSEIEDIELPIMMGMKLDYKTFVFELNNISLLIKDLHPMVNDFNLLLNKLIGNYDGVRLSNDRNIYRHSNNLYNIGYKVDKILKELVEGKKPVDVKQVKQLFNNVSGMKDIKDSYVKAYMSTINFDLTKYKNSIDEMVNLIDVWLPTLHGNGDEVKASTNIVNLVKNTTNEFATITTLIGMYVLQLNQTSNFFISNIKILANK
jgi:hypothetical protein